MNLHNIRDLRSQIESKKERIERLRSAMEIGSRQMQLSPAKTAPRDKLADDIALIDELERELVGDVVTLEVGIQAAEGTLTALPEQQRMVVWLRDFQGLKWSEVSGKSHYSVSHCRLIYRKAYKNLSTNNHF